MRAKYYNYRRESKHNAEDNEDSRKDFWSKIREPLKLFTGVLAISTVALTVVAGLQLCTLDKTDMTLKENQRAFIYVADIVPTQIEGGIYYTIKVTNSGTTKALHATAYYGCVEVFDVNNKNMYSRNVVVGPNQSVGVGSCHWPANEPQISRISAMVTYVDAFTDWHITKFCREIRFDPAKSLITPFTTITDYCSDHPDCADKDCHSEKHPEKVSTPDDL